MSASGDGQSWTILRLIEWTKDFLAGKGLEQPRLAAEVLLAEALGCKRLELYTRFDAVPAEAQRTAYRELVKRAAAREPIAYLVGHREFYSLDIAVTPEVLIPRPETELLAEAAIDVLRDLPEGARVWDVCTGSGCVALAIAANVPGAKVLATDISSAAVAVARGNAERLGLDDRVTLAEADLLSLPAELADWGPVDVLVSNPPYVTEADYEALPPEVRHEPAGALRAGADGLDAIGPILQGAPDVVRPGGLVAVEIGYNQAEAVWDLANAVGRYAQPALVKDGAGIERVFRAEIAQTQQVKE